jgi:hypothetical protein
MRIIGDGFGTNALHYNVEACIGARLISGERNGQFYLTVDSDRARRMPLCDHTISDLAETEDIVDGASHH